MPTAIGRSYNENALDFSTVGDNTIVAGVSGLNVRVHRIFFVVSGSVVVTFKDGSGALTGPMTFLANSTFVLDDTNTIPWFTTAVGTGFIINLSTSVQVSGRVYYHQDVQ